MFDRMTYHKPLVKADPAAPAQAVHRPQATKKMVEIASAMIEQTKPPVESPEMLGLLAFRAATAQMMPTIANTRPTIEIKPHQANAKAKTPKISDATAAPLPSDEGAAGDMGT